MQCSLSSGLPSGTVVPSTLGEDAPTNVHASPLPDGVRGHSDDGTIFCVTITARTSFTHQWPSMPRFLVLPDSSILKEILLVQSRGAWGWLVERWLNHLSLYCPPPSTRGFHSYPCNPPATSLRPNDIEPATETEVRICVVLTCQQQCGIQFVNSSEPTVPRRSLVAFREG